MRWPAAWLTILIVCCFAAPVSGQTYANNRVFVRLVDSPVCQQVDCWPDLLELVERVHGTERQMLPNTAPSLRPVRGPGATGQQQTNPVPTASSLPLTGPAERLQRTWLLTFDPALTDVEDLIEALEALDEVEWAQPDHVGHGAAPIPNDPAWILQWYLEQNSDIDLDALLLWDITEGSEDVIVAVLDSGIDSQHPDFSGKIVAPTDIVYGGTNPDDGSGHGTNLAGVAVGIGNNGAGGAGLCPRCRVMPVKVLDDDDFGYYSWWVDGIMYAIQNDADVINMSLGGLNQNVALEDAVAYAESQGVVVMAAMMNADERVTYYPAGYAGTIAIGATDQNDERASPFAWGGGSNWGPHIDLVAPGQLIDAAAPGGGHEPWSGTSQATAVVSGTAALMLSLNPELSPQEVRQILTDTALDQVGRPDEDVEGWDEFHGAGRLNALAALTAAGNLEDSDGDGYPDLIDCAEGGADANPELAIGCEVGGEDVTDPGSDAGVDLTGDGDVGSDVGDTADTAIDTALEPAPETGGKGGNCSVGAQSSPGVGWLAMFFALFLLWWRSRAARQGSR